MFFPFTLLLFLGCEPPSAPLDQDPGPLVVTSSDEFQIPDGDDMELRPVAHASGTTHHYTAAGFKNMAFTATRFEDGSVVGQIQYKARGIREGHYAVRCIEVHENVAFIAGIATHVRKMPNVNLGDPYAFTVWDQGEGVNDPPDLASRGWMYPGVPIEEICANLSAYVEGQVPYEVLRGNVQVMHWEW
jgi:hypothetical protein